LTRREQLLGVLPEIPDQIQADELLVGGGDVLAAAGIRHGVRARHRIEHGEMAVDGEAQPHFVDRLAGAAHAGLHRVVVALDVAEVAFESHNPSARR
jgi:hypothetical protein